MTNCLAVYNQNSTVCAIPITPGDMGTTSLERRLPPLLRCCCPCGEERAINSCHEMTLTAVCAPLAPCSADAVLISTRKNWADARAHCLAIGRDLVTIPNAAVNEQVRAMVAQIPIPHSDGNRLAWIGYSDQAEEGEFRWSDGSNSGYANWRTESNEPNNGGGGEDCALIWASPGASNSL